jgi:lipopolysaccharide transport system ATP-binding protein
MAGIFRPDKGSVVREGEVSTFLDGGFGLDPQLTGRSNCESRAIMARMRGVRSKEMVKWVEEFSELGDYFDQPVRTYSTGMIMRLVFAIGTAQTHQILLIDEGLGTADAHFQTKALERLREMYNNAPIMVLASHSIDLLKQHCQRGIVIIDGQVAFDGTLESASEFYSQHPRGNQPHTA